MLVPSRPGRTACNNYRASTGGIAATDQDVFQNVKSLAAYAQGNVHFSDQLTLTLGGRWTSDKKRGTYAQASSPFTQTLRATEALTFPGISESRFTYRVSLNYKPTEDVHDLRQPFDRLQIGAATIRAAARPLSRLSTQAASSFPPSVCSTARRSRTMNSASSRPGSIARSSPT